MTPYQRGHRDALLALATDLEESAAAEEAAYPDDGRYRVGGERHQAVLGARWRAQAKRANADQARRRAEALPHDPEQEGADHDH